MKFVLVIFILIISETSASRTCRPIISEGSLSKVELGEYIFIDCLIASCKDVIQVIFEKTGLTNAIEWKAVFEGFNKTNYQILDVDNYSLKNRCSYKAFRAKHILNVKHLSIEDQGEWRCVVVDPNRKYLSNSMEVMIYVTPEERSMNISSKNDVLLVDRLEEFTCTIDGINPEPVILWKVNDTEYSEGITFNTKHTNGLWNVKNILRLNFSQTGETAINCIMEIGTNNQLLQRKVEKHIQESAKITYPVAEIDVKANAYSTFTLKCTGTAYKPHIIWTLDDEEISNNCTGYIIDQKCNTLMCESSITSKPVGGCLNMLQYTGIYTCVVTSEQPNLSTQRSPNMVVNIPIKQCKGEYDGLKLNNTIWIATFISLIVLCMVMISMALVLYRSRIKEGSLETEQTEPLIVPHGVNEYVAESLNKHEQETSIKTETMAESVVLSPSPMFLEIPSDEEIVMFRQMAEEEYCSFRKLMTVMNMKFDVYENNQIGLLAAERPLSQTFLFISFVFTAIANVVTILIGLKCLFKEIKHAYEPRECHKDTSFSRDEDVKLKNVDNLENGALKSNPNCTVKCFRKSSFLLFPYAVALTLYCMPAAVCVPSSVYNDPNTVCVPTISDSTPDEDTFRQIECEISRCKMVSRIRYEKTDVLSPTKWTPVFEGINKTVYYSLKTENDYTLDHRADYTAFHTKHLLYIRPLTLEDQGEWRCVVYEDNNTKCPSQSVVVNKHVTPKKDMIAIIPDNVTMVTGQIAKFKCFADAINPEPIVDWTVNGVQYGRGTADNNKRRDGLWTVNNTINIGFDYAGVNIVECAMKTTTRDAWLNNKISIDVKEPAKVLDPQEELNIAPNANYSFHLLCSGSGYRPKLTWVKDDNTFLDNDPAYIIQKNCDTERCTGSIAPRVPDLKSGCLRIEQYAGVYKCVISLEPPYNSHQISANMNVYIPYKLCDDQVVGLLIGLIISTVAFAILLVVAIVFGIYRRWFQKTADKGKTANEEEIPMNA